MTQGLVVRQLPVLRVFHGLLGGMLLKRFPDSRNSRGQLLLNPERASASRSECCG